MDSINFSDRKMLSVLTRIVRMKAATVVAVLYAVTVLAPPAALAITGPNGLVHCFTEAKSDHDHGSHGTASHTHQHVDGTVHSHDDQNSAPQSADSKGPAAACCGLFSVTAMVSASIVEFPALAVVSTVVPFPPTPVEGQGPGRINRPPIA
ncbi:MAG: hypothetical protein AB1490_00515 [Pseudomonadota bacterium]